MVFISNTDILSGTDSPKKQKEECNQEENRVIVSQTILIKFLDKKTNITLQFLKNFWSDGKVVDQLLLAVLYKLTLKFITNEKFAPHCLR